MILSARNLYKSFGKNHILEGLDLEVAPGKLYGIVGENGSGKSTLLKILVGQWRPNRGEVIVHDKIGYCPQKVTLFPHLTVDEHFSFFAAAYRLKSEVLQENKQHLTEYFSFGKYLNEKVAYLSGGTAQKLNLCLALLHNPKLLILDEPYNGFDWDTYLKFWEYVGKLRNENCSLLIVSHFITEKQLFDRIFTLENGKLI